MKEMEMTGEPLPLDQPEDGSGSVTITCDVVPDPAMNCHYARSNRGEDCSAKEKVLGVTANSSEAHSPTCGEDRGNTLNCNSSSSSSLESDEPCDSSNISNIILNSDKKENDISNSNATHEKCFATNSDPLCGNGESSFLKEEKINDDKLSDEDCNPEINFIHVKEEKQNVLLNKTSTNNYSTDDILENHISSRMENVSFSSPVIVSSLTKKVTATEHANNINIPVHSAFSTFQTISFQPHTTPCINFPIFSCKSSTDGQYSDQDNTASSILNGSIGCASRRTKSSDALFNKISSSSLSENQNNFDFSRKSERLEICTVPFKPSYGSYSKIGQGINKNVIERYQHISMMKPYLSISPEELRCEYQLRCESSNGFKLNALVNEKFGAEEKQDQGVQTEKDTSEIGPNLKEIWRALECPVCLDVVLPPVHQCEQGHHVCSSCWLKVVSCPLCKRRKSTSRNYVAETLVEQIPLPCKYRIEGCKETVQHESKRTHESGCLYRMYQCPVLGCKQSHSYPNMGKHFTTFHKSLVHHEGHSIGKGEKFCDILYKESLEHGLIHVFDITKWGLFFLRNDCPSFGKSTTLFVQILPASADKAAYFYQLEVSDHRDCRKESYKGQVFPLGKTTQEIIKEEEYLELSQLILKTVKKSTPLKIVVTIWQLKAAFTFSTK